MAANFLGLFFLIIGTAGISNVFSLKELFHKSKRSSYPIWPAESFDLSFKGRSDALCRYKYGPFACKNIVYDPPYFRIKTNHNRKHYPKWQNPYFRHGFAQGHPFEDPIYDIYDPYESSEENISEQSYIRDNSFETHVNSEEKLSDYIRASTPLLSYGNPTQSNAYSKSITPATSSEGVSFATDLSLTNRKQPDLKFMKESNRDSREIETTLNPEISQIIHGIHEELQQKSSYFTKKENADLIGVKNTPPTLENSNEGGTTESNMNNKDLKSTSKLLINILSKSGTTDSSFIPERESRMDGPSFPKSDPVISHLTTPETKRQSGWELSLKKSSSLQERSNEPKEEKFLTESPLNQDSSSIISKELISSGDRLSSSEDTELTNHHDSKIFGKMSTVFQDPSSLVTREVTSMDDKISSSIDIQPTSDKESMLDPTASENSSSVRVDEERSLKPKSSSSEGFFSVRTQNVDTESDVSLSSFTTTHDGTASQSKLSSSFETQSTAAEILKTESTKENSTSLNKVTSTPFTDKVEEDKRSTASPSLKIHFTPQAITQDHIIEISSIRTARIVVTTVFLAIALTALTVLAVYIFRLRRKEVEYDQLMLIT